MLHAGLPAAAYQLLLCWLQVLLTSSVSIACQGLLSEHRRGGRIKHRPDTCLAVSNRLLNTWELSVVVFPCGEEPDS